MIRQLSNALLSKQMSKSCCPRLRIQSLPVWDIETLQSAKLRTAAPIRGQCASTEMLVGWPNTGWNPLAAPLGRSSRGRGDGCFRHFWYLFKTADKTIKSTARGVDRSDKKCQKQAGHLDFSIFMLSFEHLSATIYNNTIRMFSSCTFMYCTQL